MSVTHSMGAPGSTSRPAYGEALRPGSAPGCWHQPALGQNRAASRKLFNRQVCSWAWISFFSLKKVLHSQLHFKKRNKQKNTTFAMVLFIVLHGVFSRIYRRHYRKRQVQQGVGWISWSYLMPRITTHICPQRRAWPAPHWAHTCPKPVSKFTPAPVRTKQLYTAIYSL